MASTVEHNNTNTNTPNHPSSSSQTNQSSANCNMTAMNGSSTSSSNQTSATTAEEQPTKKRPNIEEQQQQQDDNGDNLDDNNENPPPSTITTTTTTTTTTKMAITLEGEMPKKKFYRARAHCNPLAHNNNFDYPSHPSLMDWSIDHYPNVTRSTASTDISPDVLDIGCGFGGLTIALSTLLPDKFILGLEIRAKVAEYVRLRIMACRRDSKTHPSTNTDTTASLSTSTSTPAPYENCSVMKSNTMKYMPNLFHKQSLEKIFFCFPDPHFKRKNHPRRIVSERLLSEYAYFLKPNIGRLYTITDVEELHQWHVDKCSNHPCFRELTKVEMENDVCVKAMYCETEEGKKVERAGSQKYYAVYQRVDANVDEDMDHPGDDHGDGITAETFWNQGEFGVCNVD